MKVVLILIVIQLFVRAMDCYQVLGLQRGASKKQVKEQFRKLTFEYHPDKNPSPAAQRKYKIITNAYQSIKEGRIRECDDFPEEEDTNLLEEYYQWFVETLSKYKIRNYYTNLLEKYFLWCVEILRKQKIRNYSKHILILAFAVTYLLGTFWWRIFPIWKKKAPEYQRSYLESPQWLKVCQNCE